MSVKHKHQSVKDLVPVVQSTTREAFCARYDHPFLFGREVLEEEFQFNTLVTNDVSRESRESGPSSPAVGTDVFRIRHWVIPVRKPEGAAGQDRIFLGRGETNDICVPHRTVSKLHAYFQRDPNILTRWFVVDTGSANGTKANGLKVPPRARVDLVDGDVVVFGRCVFQWMTAATLYERVEAMAPGEIARDEGDLSPFDD